MASILETLRYRPDESTANGSEDFNSEGKFGVPRFDGQPAALSEYCFRVRARAKRESLMEKTEVSKLGPLGLRLIEGQRGTALRLAQQTDQQALAGEQGHEILLTLFEKSLKPKKIQEARELYAAGSKDGGMLSRQNGESMASYIMRRRAWWHHLQQLDGSMQVSETILAEQLLVNAGITEDQSLMVRTTVGGKMTMDCICEELINQRPRVHEREKHRGKGYGGGFKPWKKGFKGGRSYMAGYDTEWDESAENSYANFTEEPYDHEYEQVSEETYAGKTSGGGSNFGRGKGSHKGNNKGNKNEKTRVVYFSMRNDDGKNGSSYECNMAVVGNSDPGQDAAQATPPRSSTSQGMPSSLRMTPTQPSSTAMTALPAMPQMPSRIPRQMTSEAFPTVPLTVDPRVFMAAMAEQSGSVPAAFQEFYDQGWTADDVLEHLQREQQQANAMTAALPSPTTSDYRQEALNDPLALQVLGTLTEMEVDTQETPVPADFVAPTASAAEVCPHHNITRKGTNAYFYLETCLDCHQVVKRERKEPAVSPAPSKATSYGTPAGSDQCPHQRVSWKGSNGFNWRSTCMDCGRVTSGRWTSAQRTASTPGISSPFEAASGAMYLHMRDLQEICRTLQLVAAVKMTQKDGPLQVDELQDILRAVVLNFSGQEPGSSQAPSSLAPSPAPSRTTQPPANEDDNKIIDFGKYKHKTFDHAYQDSNYVAWCIKEVNEGSCRGLKNFVRYCKNRQSNRAYMAVEEHSVPESNPLPRKEQWLIAILDSGCNKTCHGENWMKRYFQAIDATADDFPLTSDESCIKGINGQVTTLGSRRLQVGFSLEGDGGIAVGTIDSMELQGSDAPLLLSIHDQRRLELQMELSPQHPDRIYSKKLGGYLEVVSANGLVGLHLLPAHLALLGIGLEGESGDKDAENHWPETATTEPAFTEPSEDLDTSPKSTTSSVETFIELDLENTKVMTKGQKKQLRENIQEVEAQDRCMWSALTGSYHKRALPKGCKVFLLEIFAGAAILSTMAMSLGLEVANPVDIALDGSNLLLSHVRDAIDKEILEKDPFAITFSPVCGPWGPWSHLNMSRSQSTCDKIQSDRDSWYPTLRWISKRPT